MKFASSFSRVLGLVSKYSAVTAAVMVLAMLAIVLFEVTYRTITGYSPFLGVEMGGYLLVVSVALAQAYTLEKGVHVRISSLANRASPVLRQGIEVIWNLLGLALVALLTYYALRLTIRSYSLGAVAPTYWKTPIYIPQSILVLGMGIFTLRFASHLYSAWTSFLDMLRKRRREMR